MALPTPASSWMQGLDLPSRVFSGNEVGFGSDDYELYEEEDAFVLTVNLPGFETEDIELAWDDGVLNIAAEQVDEDRNRRRTFHRRFRFPKDVDDEAISAEYTNGVLEVELPLVDEATTRGKTIPIEG